MPRHSRLLLLSVVLSLLPAVLTAVGGARAGEINERRSALYVDYGQKLSKLADECDAQKLAAASEALRAWLPTRNDDQLTLFVVPAEKVAEPEPESTTWRAAWRRLRVEQADALFRLALEAVAAGQAGLACELAMETLRENPDHKQARRALGYVKFRERWHTPFEIRQLSAGKVWHDKFGWLPKAHVERYEQGERYYQGRWMSAADEVAARSDLKRGWRVESAHYVVTTNHSLEEGVRLSRQLETLYQAWQQAFVTFSTDEAELRRRFEGRGTRRDTKPHDVICFRNRAEYNHALRASQPKIDITLGIYLDTARTAYFFAGDEQDPGTVYHEATHQLFHETRPAAVDAGRRDNFWIIEGIACYMESLAAADDHVTLGGANAGRMPAARHRIFEDGFYVPLAQLVTLGLEDLQRDPRIAMLYSQSAGLADFFMHEGQGRYREPLVRYLVAVYAARANAGTLAELTASGYEVLDRQYRAFMSPDALGESASERASR